MSRLRVAPRFIRERSKIGVLVRAVAWRLRFGSVSLFGLLVLVMSWTAPSICAAVEQQTGSLKSAGVLYDRSSGHETFRCAGHFGPSSTRATLTALFGAQEVVTQE